MSPALKFFSHSLSLLPQLGFSEFSYSSIYGTCRRPKWGQSQRLSVCRVDYRPLCSINGDKIGSGSLDAAHGCSHEDEGSVEKTETDQREPFSSKEVLGRLRRYGISGILSYGLLNTAYYLTTFLLVWFYVAPAPGRMGYFLAVERFIKMMAMVWAGSQVTKLVRAAGALALAPFVDRGLSWFTVKFKFESQGKAFMVIVGLCFGLVMMLFLVVTLLQA